MLPKDAPPPIAWQGRSGQPASDMATGPDPVRLIGSEGNTAAPSSTEEGIPFLKQPLVMGIIEGSTCEACRWLQRCRRRYMMGGMGILAKARRWNIASLFFDDAFRNSNTDKKAETA